MGSKVLALLDADDPAPIIDQVQLWFDEWEQTLSRFRLDSELSRLNAEAGVTCQVSPTLWAVLQTSF